jgi:hypothetical protein
MPGDAAARRDFSDDDHLVGALRRGDESAFVWLLEEYAGPLRRIARGYVPTVPERRVAVTSPARTRPGSSRQPRATLCP